MFMQSFWTLLPGIYSCEQKNTKKSKGKLCTAWELMTHVCVLNISRITKILSTFAERFTSYQGFFKFSRVGSIMDLSPPVLLKPHV